ncbi:trehalose 6-phosphate phosphatase [Massilia aurea]|jgi:trehalose 6-phosphate phosphatase|uniref:Trehalose 6-phosphate phosphatase n=1 Tax=Massilia aurea TaxID=373040 RepID=A0A7X0CE26_9BURK|nr:trehalose-phosphatase [Massilia aurea]MBB6133827.1 trehalose 6-phosphate phosphatase [Massilia aurea]
MIAANDNLQAALDLLAAPDCALFLDFDGTLVDIAPLPDQVIVTDMLRSALPLLQARLNGRLALVSGRPINELDKLLAPLTFPAAGVHGMERRGVDGVVRRLTPPDFALVRQAAQGLAARHPDLWVEEKHGALALHFRQAPELQALCTDAMRVAVDASPGLLLMEGKMIVEVKSNAVSKGTAIRDFLADAPFAGYRPLFIGDDTTDEAGFAQVQSIGGIGLKVGPGPTVAQCRIASAEQLRIVLSQAAAAPTIGKDIPHE